MQGSSSPNLTMNPVRTGIHTLPLKWPKATFIIYDSFSNIGFSGGLKITYREGDKIIKEDTSQVEKLCFIDGKGFIATDARFGGIEIQTEK